MQACTDAWVAAEGADVGTRARFQGDDRVLRTPEAAWGPPGWLCKLHISVACYSCALVSPGDVWAATVRVTKLCQHLSCQSLNIPCPHPTCWTDLIRPMPPCLEGRAGEKWQFLSPSAESLQQEEESWKQGTRSLI